jgi:hypothetical protein
MLKCSFSAELACPEDGDLHITATSSDGFDVRSLTIPYRTRMAASEAGACAQVSSSLELEGGDAVAGQVRGW